MNREALMDDIFDFVPLIHKKIFREIQGYDITKHQIRFMLKVLKENGKPMKHYCDCLMISKPNLTTLTNKLIEDGLLERKTDEKDRRVINIYITNKGEEYLNAIRKKVKKDMLTRFSVLSDEEINKLDRSFKEIKGILNKLD